MSDERDPGLEVVDERNPALSALIQERDGWCKYGNCPFPQAAHYCWGRGTHTCFGPPTHQHWPKRSHGGRNVVAMLCLGLHDAIDNGFRFCGRRWANEVTRLSDLDVYRLRDRETGAVILSVPIHAAR